MPTSGLLLYQPTSMSRFVSKNFLAKVARWYDFDSYINFFLCFLLFVLNGFGVNKKLLKTDYWFLRYRGSHILSRFVYRRL
jgi:hypothetical protein